MARHSWEEHYLYWEQLAARRPTALPTTSEDADDLRDVVPLAVRQRSEAIEERAGISPDDPFEPADVTPAQAVTLRGYLWQYAQMRATYLARKAVKRCIDKPLYVLVLRLRGNAFTQQEADLLEQIAHNLPVSPPLSKENAVVLALIHRFAPLVKHLQGIRQATLFER